MHVNSVHNFTRIAVARSIGDPDFKEIPGSPNNAMSCYPDIVEHKITPDVRQQNYCVIIPCRICLYALALMGCTML